MKASFFQNIPVRPEKEIFETLVEEKGVSIERIVSCAHASPEGFWYDQKRNEFVLVMQGRASIRFKDPDTTVILETGDYLHIPAHTLHRVEWTEAGVETLWLAVHY
ncbi:cupin domain-containing protein [Desulfobotulus sp.]|uniref:cupin domain-containing protein n=1 Tax=Desulfobotulus sp. TaxID=1940337 RepID=UPI002A35AA10|nr:cupin domain-containing protein [Desulfobotulus sp.]MDY0163818.1 cupin domain-containing protein [Desulfobotulus sp.]